MVSILQVFMANPSPEAGAKICSIERKVVFCIVDNDEAWISIYHLVLYTLGIVSISESASFLIDSLQNDTVGNPLS